jgi:hypothetical protein
MKALLALSILIPTPIAPATHLPMIVVQPEAIVQVICVASDGDVLAGSAFRVGPTLMASVNHVTSSGRCSIDGKPINLAYKSPTSDYSEVVGDDGPYLSIDCGGFIKGRKYLAIGYARGVTPTTTVEITATGEHAKNGQAILIGMVPVIPGQSGGPIIDEATGKVVGMVNAENFEAGLSWSLELRNTPLCGAKA